MSKPNPKENNLWQDTVMMKCLKLYLCTVKNHFIGQDKHFEFLDDFGIYRFYNVEIQVILIVFTTLVIISVKKQSDMSRRQLEIK